MGERVDLDDLGRRLAPVVSSEYRALVFRTRIADDGFEDEAVELGLRQWIGAFVLDRVLRREHEKWVGQRERLAFEGDLPLLHRLEQRALRLRGRAVDLVGEHNVREDGAGARAE